MYFILNPCFLHIESVFPPVFGRRLQAQVVKKGDRVIMEVEVSGTPEPTVTWHKDGKPIQEAMASPFRLKTQGLCHQLIIDKGMHLSFILIKFDYIIFMFCRSPI